MTIDYGAVLYDPVYAEIGVPAVLTVTGADTGTEITVIDDTRPKTLPTGASTEVTDVAPGAYARIAELTANGVTRAGYLNATLVFNGRAWVVQSYELRGSPMGEDQGEARFLLKASSG